MVIHKGTQTIKTNRIKLRRFTVEDSKDVFEKWTSSYENSRFVMEHPHDSIKKTEQMLLEYEKNYNNPAFYMWGIIYEDKLIGYICGNEINEAIKSICIGYCITRLL